MKLTERAENIALGLSVLGWSVVAFASAERSSIVRLTITLLNLTVGVLFLARAPLAKSASIGALVASVPSLLTGGVALWLAPAIWPRAAEILFAVAGAFTIVALMSLGRAFAVLPGVRYVVARGPYRWIRHPAYAGEIAMVGASALARADVLGAAVFAGALGLAAVRILVEERALAEAPAYVEYARKVRFRLLPGVW